jgi:hypothetical protein
MTKGFFVVPTPAPRTPLNLKTGVVYAPRVPTPPFVAFDAVEVRPDVFEVRGYDDQGVQAFLFQGHALQTYQKLATHLRMDLRPEDPPWGSSEPRTAIRTKRTR